MKKLIAEFIGTFALVFCGTGAAIINDITAGSIGQVGIGLTFGAIVCVMIYSFGSISGAHINPAVSLSMLSIKKMKLIDSMGYIVVQVLGAIAASFTLHFLFPTHEGLGATLPLGSQGQSFVLELILTYFLMLVILMVGNHNELSSFTGMAVGATVMLEATFAGPICGASMNPARSIGPALVSGNLSSLWIYIAAPILGALLSALTWLLLGKGAETK